jgi:hypothetical protein
MASWVAPAIAAEMWGVSVDFILAGIADGSISSCVDGQFLFVDIAASGYAASTPRPAPAEHPILSKEELQALTFQPVSDVHPESIPDQPQRESVNEEEDDSSRDISLWRISRQQASRLRRPPHAEAA